MEKFHNQIRTKLSSWISKEQFALILIISIAVVPRLTMVFLNARPDYDESAFSYSATLILKGYLPYKDFELFRTPLYPYILALTFIIGGFGIIQCRLPSVIFSVFSLIGIFLVGKEIENKKLGLIAAAVYAISFFSIIYDSLGKSESLNNFLVLFSIYFILRWSKSNSYKSLFLSSIFFVLAIYTALRGAIYVFPAYLIFFLIRRNWKSAILFSAMVIIMYSLLCAPFIILAPSSFFLNVFLFNITRNQQTWPLDQVLQYLIGNGGAIEVVLGSISISLGTLLAWQQHRRRQADENPIKPFYYTLLLTLFLSFFTILASVGFIHPYLLFPIWPVLCLGVALGAYNLLDSRRRYTFDTSINLNMRKQLKVMTLSAILLLSVAYIAQEYISFRLASNEIDQSSQAYSDSKNIAAYIETNSSLSSRVLTTDPSFFFILQRNLTVPPAPYGGSIDILNHFHFAAMVSIIGSNASLGELLLTIFNPPKASIVEAEKNIAANELSNLLDHSDYVMINDFFKLNFPDYDSIISPILSERCSLLKRFDEFGIEVYRVS